MTLISTLYQLNHLEDILHHADGVILGHSTIGTRLTTPFTIDEIDQAVKRTKALGKKIFIQANRVYNDSELAMFEEVIHRLPMDVIDGIVVADLGAYEALNQMGHGHKTIYNPETLITNHYDFNFYASMGMKGVFVAKEITLEDILLIGKEKQTALFMVGHGHLNMFYSKRQLIETFSTFKQIEDHHFHNSQHLKLIEETRQDLPYPVLEDDAGTHVFRSQVFSTLSQLKELSQVVDYMIVDTIFKDDHYALDVLPMYQKGEPNLQVIDRLKAQYQEIWDEGFLHKKTIYKVSS